jgi:hypothetical protein
VAAAAPPSPRKLRVRVPPPAPARPALVGGGKLRCVDELHAAGCQRCELQTLAGAVVVRRALSHCARGQVHAGAVGGG